MKWQAQHFTRLLSRQQETAPQDTGAAERPHGGWASVRSSLLREGAAAATNVGASGAVAHDNDVRLMAGLGFPNTDTDTSTENGQMAVGSQGTSILSTVDSNTLGAQQYPGS